jgi:UDP-glucose 4-epimerase
VTGGAGYIGSHICKRVSESGYTPIALDDLSTGNEWAVKWGPLIKASIDDIDALRAIRTEYKPIALLHTAALSDAAASKQEEDRYWRVNVGGTASIRMVFAALPIVQSSTAAVYGDVEKPLTEDCPPVPTTPYGRTKLAAEQHDFDAIRLRYFNVAGADREIGEAHDPKPI